MIGLKNQDAPPLCWLSSWSPGIEVAKTKQRSRIEVGGLWGAREDKNGLRINHGEVLQATNPTSFSKCSSKCWVFH